jgi:molybdopterin-guanine dinucleotide biosynthesis protein A
LRNLCERIEPGVGVVPVIENRAEPLAAIYPRDAYDDVARALSGSDFSLQSLVGELIAAGKLEPIQVSEKEKAFFRNLNEPADL